jgi:HD superfamily phosphohydrolase YqeK
MSEKKSKTDMNWEETQKQIATMIGNYDESDECLTMKNKFIQLVRSTNRPGIEMLLTELDSRKEWNLNFWNQPASTKYHGSEVGGLLRHSLNVWNQLTLIKEQSGIHCDIADDSLIIVALFHDLCKWNSYTFNITPKTKELSSQTYKWDNHLPLGHGDMSVILLQKYITLSNEEAMMIRWHMGPFDKTYFENQNNIEQYCPQARYVFLADYWASGLEGIGEDE